MKGLITKEFISIKKSMKVSVFLILFYTIYSILTDINLTPMIPVITLVLVSSTFSYDEYNHWDRIAMSMPVSAKQIVNSKFLFTFIISVIVSLFSLAFTVVASLVKNNTETLTDDMLAVLLTTLSSCLLIFVMIPVYIKYGVEKGKIIFFIMVISFLTLIFLLSNIFSINFSEISDTMFTITIIIAVAVVGIISYLSAVKIYSNKEF